MKRCDIIIPVWNEPDITKECVDSILKHTDYPYRLIIIDNGSDGETEKYLGSLKGIKGLNILLIRNDKNLGFIKAVNQGIRVSDAPYLCLMNNDTVATDGWLGEMAEVMDSHPEIGLVNPSSNTSGQSPDQGKSIEGYALGLGRFKGNIQWLSTARGFCMLIKREVVVKIGLFDEAYSLGYFEEADYSRKARKTGYAIARVKSSYVYHKGSASFKKIEGASALFEKNEKIFYERWGRPVRVGYFVNKAVVDDRVDEIAREIAKNGHEIWIFLKEGSPDPIKFDHFGIRIKRLNKHFFAPLSVYNILKRKKKKALEILVTDDKALSYLLKLTAFFHGSKVLISGQKEDLAEMIAKKSKLFCLDNERKL